MQHCDGNIEASLRGARGIRVLRRPPWRELRLNELVLKPLMVSFAAIVFNVIGDGSAERAFSDENESVQAFLFDTANESLRKCIQIGRTRWKPEALNTCRLKQDAELFSVER